MIRCHVLGPVRLNGPDGKPLDEVVSQPRRLALLAYLAMHAPRGFVRRDALLPVFWPELDQERARGALRQALYVLRTALGPGVIVTRGAEEVTVALDLLWCDALEFDREYSERRWPESLALYTGDFLEAFFIAEAPEFERWMQEKQGQMRLRAAAAARTLAADQEAAGRLSDAVSSTRRALTLNAVDEEALRRLLTLLDREGDRAGAAHAYDEFVERLEAEYGAPPSAETKAVFERIQRRDQVLTPGIVGPQPARGNSATEVVPIGAPVAENVPRRSLGRRWAVAAGIVLTLGAAALAVSAWPSRTLPDSPDRLVILPFDVRGETGDSYLREALVDLLSTDLDGAAGIATIDPNATRAVIEADTLSSSLDGLSTARKLAARYFVMGTAVVAGGRIRVQSTLYDSRSVDSPIGHASREGSAEKLFEIVDGVAADLLLASQRTPGIRLNESAAMTTRSVPALKAYLEAERAFRTGDQLRAADLLRRALAIDSTFALADYRLSVVVDAVSGAWTEITQSAERAMRHAQHLSERDRLLLKAHLASVAEDVDDAERQYRAILVRYPDELEAWYRLAEVIFHQNPITGRSITESRVPFERLLALDPTNRPALQHLARIAAVEGRSAALDTLYRRTRALGFAPAEEAEVRALWVSLNGSPTDRARFIEEIARAAQASGTATWVTATFAGDLGATERMIRAQAAVRGVTADPLGSLSIARIRAIQGQLDRAAVELREAAKRDETAAFEQEAFFAILPFRTLSPIELRAWRSRVAAWHPTPTDPSTMNNNDVSGPWRRHLCLYLLAEIDGLLRDTTAVRIATDSMERLAVPALPDAGVFARELVASARAHALWRGGDAKAAIALMEKTPRARPYHYRGSYTRKQDRYVRAELLFAAGRFEEALVWYGSFDFTSTAELVFATPAHLRRGQIYERLGDPRQARDHYNRFLELWKAADTTFQAMTTLARERLTALH